MLAVLTMGCGTLNDNGKGFKLVSTHHLTGDPEVVDNGKLDIVGVATLPAWTAACEGRFMYALDTNTMYYGTDTGWRALQDPPKIKHHYGTGLDGDVDINSGAFSSGPIVNNALTRDAHFDNLTLSGGDLNTSAFRLFVRSTLTIGDGYKVHMNGANGGNATNGVGAIKGAKGLGSPAPSLGTMDAGWGGYAGGDGGNGGSGTTGGTGSNGGGGGSSSSKGLGSNGPAGTNGGDGGTPNKGIKGTGGVGGVVDAIPTTGGGVTNLVHLTLWRYFDVSGPSWDLFYGHGNSAGSGGGGGGGGSLLGVGGGGGGGGGAGCTGGSVYVAAYEIIDNNAGGDGIQAKGGNGGNGGNGGDASGGPGDAGGGGGGGGGAGAGGGIVVIVTHSIVGYTVALCCPGGTGGTGGTGGAKLNAGTVGVDALAGNTGTDGLLFLFCQEP
jgi:hypothetical protein